MKRFRYCKERLKERNDVPQYQEGGETFKQYLVTLPGRVACSHTSPFLFFSLFFSQSLFSFSQFNVEYM